MRLLLLIFALSVGCGADRVAEARPEAARGPAVLRVVTWNVHDLFDDVDRTEPPGDLDSVLTTAEVEAKLARVGRVIARASPDVAVLEEVENIALLERLAAGPLAAGGYAAYLREGLDPRGIDVGVLSRVPVVSFVSHLGERAPDGSRLWSRDCVEVHVTGAGRPVVLLGNHFVSRLDPAQDRHRAEQAARVRALADEVRGRDPRSLVVVLGDLNDLPGSRALAPLLGDGAFSDLGAALPDTEAWTWTGGRERERIDYVLLPRPDAGAAARVEVLAGEDVAAASDHRPVVADLWTE
jgi:endonuclease/exonuclease/phosphatase family metal-dependent hydrolase